MNTNSYRDASAVVTGARHLRAGRNGQDAATTIVKDDIAVAVVCDGCSAGASSEVGARLGARWFARAVADRLIAGASVTDPATWADARVELAAMLRMLAAPHAARAGRGPTVDHVATGATRAPLAARHAGAVLADAAMGPAAAVAAIASERGVRPAVASERGVASMVGPAVASERGAGGTIGPVIASEGGAVDGAVGAMVGPAITSERGVAAMIGPAIVGFPGSDSGRPAIEIDSIDRSALHDCFLFTIVAAAMTREGAAVWALGDGAYAIDGEARALGPFANNEPPYVAYDLVGDARPAHLDVRGPEVRTIVVATDGAHELADAELELGAFAAPPFLAHPDALRRQLVVLARGEERIDWNAQRLVRTPAVLQDDCGIAILQRARELA